MEVIRKQAPREYLETVSLLEISKKFEELDRFLWFGKNPFASREAVVDVVQATLDQNP